MLGLPNTFEQTGRAWVKMLSLPDLSGLPLR